MKFILKFFLFSFLTSALILTGLYFLPHEYYKQAISWIVRAQTGADLDIRGDIKLQPFSDEVLKLNDVTLVQRPDNAQVTLDFGQISFVREELEISKVRLSDSSVNYTDHLAKADYSITKLNTDVDLPIKGRPLKVEGDGVVYGQRLTFDANADNPEGLGKGEASNVVANLAAPFVKLNYNAKHKKQHKTGRFTADIGSLNKLLGWLSVASKIEGSGEANLDFDIEGSDMATFDGKADIDFKNLIQGYTDEGLNQLISHITGKSMTIKELTGTFDINKGVVTNNDLVGIGPTKFTGNGTVNLVDQTLNYKIIPELNVSQVSSVPQIKAPVTIKGTFQNPVITVEAQDVIKEVIKKPEQIIKTIEDVTTNNEAGKQIKKDLQGLRDKILKDPESQQLILDNLLNTAPAAQ